MMDFRSEYNKNPWLVNEKFERYLRKIYKCSSPASGLCTDSAERVLTWSGLEEIRCRQDQKFQENTEDGGRDAHERKPDRRGHTPDQPDRICHRPACSGGGERRQ
jgi:hypothetical protein